MDIRNFFVKKPRLEDSNNSHVTIPKSNDHQAGDDNVQIASTSSTYKNQNTPAPSDLVRMGKLIKQVELKTYPKLLRHFRPRASSSREGRGSGGGIN
jgi:hypothetical protein